MMEPNMIDVIIVNYNSTHQLLRCLESLAGERDEELIRVIVHDNSENGGIGSIESRFPKVDIRRNGGNLGFARAVNQALTESNAPYTILLNPDTVVLGGFFEAVLSYMERNPQVGIIGPTILNADGSVQGSARSFPSPLTGLFGRGSILTRLFPNNRISRANILTDKSEGKVSVEVDWVSGACMAIRREAIDQVGPLDERFFLYWEDADWCARMRKKGWKVIYYPAPRVIHFVGGSSSKRPLRSMVDFHKSAFRLFYKYSGAWMRIMSPLVAGALACRLLSALMINKGVGRLLQEGNKVSRIK
jgi:GT2 family glycosyltransferase